MSLASDGRLDQQAWREWEAAYLDILDLAPADHRQRALKTIMLERVREVSDLRSSWENAASAGTNALFLVAAVAGIAIVSISYFPFPPSSVNLMLLAIFGVYTGMVICFLVGFANPFSGAGYVEPLRFERHYEGMLDNP